MTESALASALSWAVPATYVLSIAVLVGEYVVLRLLKEPISHRQGRASVLSGIGAFGALALANRFGFVALLHLAWSHRLVDLGLGPGGWIAAFVVYDLLFYVAHRLGHEVRLLWCFHSVHHTSEEMRLTSAIRGSVFDFVYLPWFFVWIPVLGVHPSMLLVVEAAGRIWGVLVHVHPRFVGKLGLLDRLIVTPSVHRVHHGRDLGYLDTNYGEVLTLWDHLFGTWVVEEQSPDYGVLEPLDPGNFAQIQFSPWAGLLRDLRRAAGLRDKLRYLLDAPGFRHDGPDTRVRALRRGGAASGATERRAADGAAAPDPPEGPGDPDDPVTA